jgi:hypothetical protein
MILERGALSHALLALRFAAIITVLVELVRGGEDGTGGELIERVRQHLAVVRGETQLELARAEA